MNKVRLQVVLVRDYADYWQYMYSHRHEHSLLIWCHKYKLFEDLILSIRYEIFNVQFNT